MKWLIPSKTIKIIVNNEYVIDNRPVNMAMFAVIDKGEFNGIQLNGGQEQSNVEHEGVANQAQPSPQTSNLIAGGYPTIQFCTLSDGKVVITYEWVFEAVHERDSEFDKIIKEIS